MSAPVYLTVPFAQKDQAKALGARWDSLKRSWYVPAGVATDAFQRWLPADMQTTLAVDAPDDTSNLDIQTVDTSEKATKPAYLRLSELVEKANWALQQHLPALHWVVAELTEVNERQGHLYLTLAESVQQQQVAQVRAMVWANQRTALLSSFTQVTGQQLTAGMQVMLQVAMNLNPRFGFSLVVQDINPSFTLGEQEAKLQQIRQRLQKEGLWQANRQQRLADDFHRIAVLSPAQAAGLGDFRSDANALADAGLCEFVYFHAQFQGQQALSELSHSLQLIVQAHQQQAFDALVIIRGGGAKQDLMFLNEYELAKAVCLFPIPVLTGIGHERDRTILDEVAHRRFDTPSKSIAFIRQHIVDKALAAQQQWQSIQQRSLHTLTQAKQRLLYLQQALQQRAQQQVHQQQQQLQQHWLLAQQAMQHRLLNERHLLRAQRQQLVTGVQQQTQRQQYHLRAWQQTLLPQAQRQLQMQQHHLRHWQQLLQTLHPQRLLAQGYLLAKNSQGKWLTTAAALSQEPSVDLYFADGQLTVLPQADSLQQNKTTLNLSSSQLPKQPE